MKIAITFDDGPHKDTTPKLLDGLKKRGIKATFFLLGKNIEANPEIARRMYEEGHLLCNHTYSHMEYREKDRDIFEEEIKRTEKLIKEITGEAPGYVRPPYGTWNPELETEWKVKPVFWSVDSMDWESKNTEKIKETVLGNLKEDAIVLFHDEYDTTVESALELIDLWILKGYELVRIDEWTI